MNRRQALRSTPPVIVDGAGRWQYQLLLPPGWWHIPLDPVGSRAAIRSLLRQRFAALPRDRVAGLRREIERELAARALRAVEAGAVDLWVQANVLRGLPVTAALTVSVLPVVGDAHSSQLAEALKAPDVVELGVVVIDAGQAVRRVRRTAAGSDPDGHLGVLDDALPAATLVEYLIPMPEPGEVLLLSFSTPVDELAEVFTALFDAVAASLMWRSVDEA